MQDLKFYLAQKTKGRVQNLLVYMSVRMHISLRNVEKQAQFLLIAPGLVLLFGIASICNFL